MINEKSLIRHIQEISESARSNIHLIRNQTSFNPYRSEEIDARMTLVSQGLYTIYQISKILLSDSPEEYARKTCCYHLLEFSEIEDSQ